MTLIIILHVKYYMWMIHKIKVVYVKFCLYISQGNKRTFQQPLKYVEEHLSRKVHVSLIEVFLGLHSIEKLILQTHSGHWETAASLQGRSRVHKSRILFIKLLVGVCVYLCVCVFVCYTRDYNEYYIIIYNEQKIIELILRI